jgi:nucleoside 2-deoxyribosyltransferase
MNEQAPLCFVVMPFRAELNFFYLYLRRHLQDRHGLRVERGDHRILTVPILEKIRQQIAEARVLIADVTGRNPNVFYELGLAHALEKPVILITQDKAEDVPTDIRHLEFIRYDLGEDVDVLAKVDNAIHHVFIERYQQLYSQARAILQEFNRSLGLRLDEASPEDFQARVIQGERMQGLPDRTNDFLMADFLLPRVIRDVADGATMRKVTTWVTEKYAT